MPAKINISGHRYGRLVVIKEAYKTTANGTRWECSCDCGNTTSVLTNGLRRGLVRSCGCLRKETARQRRTTHGMSRTLVYYVWDKMIDRCENLQNKEFANYGGRGISVCSRWKVFQNFLDDMGDQPPGMTIERMNNNGHYEPGNCRWASQLEQVRNARSNWILVVDGASMSCEEFAIKVGLSARTIRNYVRRGDMSIKGINLSFHKRG